MLKHIIADVDGVDAAVNTDTGEDRGLVVATRDHKTYTTKTVFFTNSTYGKEMAQNGAYGAVAWVLHDGTDTTEADSGTADTNTLNHVIDAGQTYASSVCVGMTVHNTDDNSYAAVTVVTDTDLTCDGDVCPDGDEAFTVGPAWTFTQPVGGADWVEDDPGQFHNGTQSLYCNRAEVGDVMQLQNVNGEDVVMTSQFVALSMWVYVNNNWAGGDSFSVYAMVDGAQEGDKVYLEDYFPYGTDDQWHYINIPLSDMGLASSTLDSFRFECESIQGTKPRFYLDEITLQASGTAVDFTVEPDKGTWFHIKAFQTTFVDAHDSEQANSTVPHLSYEKILDVTPTTGYIYKRYSEGNADPISEARITSLMDLLSYPYSEITNVIADENNTLVTISNTYPAGMAFVLKAEELDKIVYSVEDDFSGLLYFRICVQGYVEQRD